MQYYINHVWKSQRQRVSVWKFEVHTCVYFMLILREKKLCWSTGTCLTWWRSIILFLWKVYNRLDSGDLLRLPFLSILKTNRYYQRSRVCLSVHSFSKWWKPEEEIIEANIIKFNKRRLLLKFIIITFFRNSKHYWNTFFIFGVLLSCYYHYF